jgi:hypothetical protein
VGWFMDPLDRGPSQCRSAQENTSVRVCGSRPLCGPAFPPKQLRTVRASLGVLTQGPRRRELGAAGLPQGCPGRLIPGGQTGSAKLRPSSGDGYRSNGCGSPSPPLAQARGMRRTCRAGLRSATIAHRIKAACLAMLRQGIGQDEPLGVRCFRTAREYAWAIPEPLVETAPVAWRVRTKDADARGR